MTEGYSFLRFLYSKYSETEYLTEAWTPIGDTLNHFLQNSDENIEPMSYQATYCQVYKSTCRGFKERLFDDVKKLVTEHCQNLKMDLDEKLKRMLDEQSTTCMNTYVLQFINFLHQYHRAIEAMVPLFHYLDIVYIKPKMRSTMRQELMILYKTILLESHLNQFFIALQHLLTTSESPSKETIELVLNMLKNITPESSAKQWSLFKRFCNGEHIFDETTSNDEDMTTPTPRTSSKRSIDDLKPDGNQPSAKRAARPMVKSKNNTSF